MSNLTEQAGECNCLDVLSLDALHEAIAHRAEDGVWLEMIDENVGIDQDARRSGHLIERHRPSSGRSSGSSAKYSASWAVPLKPMMPYALRSALSRLLTSTRTRAPSFKGSGVDGFKTPFSYVASM